MRLTVEEWEQHFDVSGFSLLMNFGKALNGDEVDYYIY